MNVILHGHLSIFIIMNLPIISILQLTDLHILPNAEDTLLGVQTEDYFHRVIDHAFKERKYDAILLSGDLAQSPCVESYTRILKTVAPYQLPVLCLPGNHDDFSLMQHLFNHPSIHCQKQVILGNWQIILLNSQILQSERGHLASSELHFLETCLNEHSALFTLIAVHHHCVPSGSKWLDTMQIDNSGELLNIVKNHANVRVITTGHIHQELHRKIGNITILGTPSTCFQFALNCVDFALDTQPPGYRIIQLHHNGNITTNVYRIDTLLEGLNLDYQGY